MKKTFYTLCRAEEKLVKVEEILISFTLIFIVFITAYFAIGRKFFERPPAGLDELARYLVPVLVMLGASVAINKKSHITAGSIDLFINNRKTIFICSLIIDALLIINCAILMYASWSRYLSLFVNPQTSQTLYIPMTLLELPIPVGMTLWLMQFILQIFKDIFYYKDLAKAE